MMNKNFEIKEEALEKVVGGISQEMIKHLLDLREKYTKLWENGELPDYAYKKLIDSIDADLRKPGCAA